MSLSKEYKDHKVFERIDKMIVFYESLSFSIFGFVTLGTKSICNIDSYVYSSAKGTLDSIKMVLENGRINDSYALLRKFYDSAIINIYTNIYLEDNFSIENFIVEQINNWLKGKEQMPQYRVMSQYIRNCQKLDEINALLYKDDRYKKIRERCNDHTHYNFYQNVLLNDNKIHLNYRVKALDVFAYDIEQIFILHLSYLFSLNDHYMMSSDYSDYMDLNLTPEEGCEYFVAPFVQNVFDDFLKNRRPDIANEIKLNTKMELE